MDGVLAFGRDGVPSAPRARSPLKRRAGRVAWIVTPVLLAGLGQVVVLKTGLLASLEVPIDRELQWRGKTGFRPPQNTRGGNIMNTLSALGCRGQAGAARHNPRFRASSPVQHDPTKTRHLRFSQR